MKIYSHDLGSLSWSLTIILVFYIIFIDILLFNTTSVLLIGHLAEDVRQQVVGNCHATISCFLSELSDD